EVVNYEHFSQFYQARLALEAVDENNNSFAMRMSPRGAWLDWGNAITAMDWKLERKGYDSVPVMTEVEPPWNSGNSTWGVFIAQSEDPAEIRSQSQGNIEVIGSILTQEMAPFDTIPELRYGRMRMEDVTVPVTQDAKVPVVIEYYKDSDTQFVTNEDDDFSVYGSNYGCSELIFPDSMQSALDSDPQSSAVIKGEGRLLVNHPQSVDAGYREQIQLGQRLSNSSAVPTCPPKIPTASDLPWLQYNWSEQGDTDPSAVVTFGVYRGNDRIIYRGEKGINTLLN
ncbi:DUF6701 domain-containing protein, partial [Photobacterium sanctipauli]